MENLTFESHSGNPGSGVSLPQNLVPTQVPQDRDAACLLSQWDSVWYSKETGVITDEDVSAWCAGLSGGEEETLWKALQDRRRKQFEEAAGVEAV